MGLLSAAIAIDAGKARRFSRSEAIEGGSNGSVESLWPPADAICRIAVARGKPLGGDVG